MIQPRFQNRHLVWQGMKAVEAVEALCFHPIAEALKRPLELKGSTEGGEGRLAANPDRLRDPR